MSELIAIREAARRLGVSDTAVHKAIKAGRVTVAGKNESNGRPLLAWPQCEVDWNRNSDANKRTHVGAQGGSKRRESYAGTAPPVAPVGRPAPKSDVVDQDAEMVIHDGMSLTEAKTAQAIWLARREKLDYERETEKLVDADAVKKQSRALATTVISGLYTIPDRISDELSGMSDATQIHGLLLAEIDRTIEDLRKAYA